MSGSGREALADVRVWLRDPPGCPGVVGKPSRISGSCLENLPDGREWWEAITNIREWSGGPTRYPVVVGGALPDVRQMLGGPPRYLGVVSIPCRISGCGRLALPDVREWCGCPPECPGVVVIPSQMSVCGWEALPDVRQWSGGTPGYPGAVGRHA